MAALPARSPDFSAAPGVMSPVVRHFVRQLLPWVLALGAYLWLATWLVRWDMARSGEDVSDFGAGLYAMYMQLFFEPTAALPRAPVARVVFWVTPLLGGLVIVRGLLRVGATLFDVEERRKLWVKIMASELKDHIVLCGLGNVGVRVAESLRALGTPVVGIERRRAESFGSALEGLGIPVIYGDVRQDELLVEAGIERAKAVVCATDDDITNLEVAIDAKRMNPRIRVIMRMFDKRVAEKMREALSLDETFSTSALAGPLVALQATEPGVRGVYRLDDGTLRAAMTLVVEAAHGRSLGDVEDALEGRAVRLLRGGAVQKPKAEVVLARGDEVTLDLSADKISEARRLVDGRGATPAARGAATGAST